MIIKCWNLRNIWLLTNTLFHYFKSFTLPWKRKLENGPEKLDKNVLMFLKNITITWWLICLCISTFWVLWLWSFLTYQLYLQYGCQKYPQKSNSDLYNTINRLTLFSPTFLHIAKGRKHFEHALRIHKCFFLLHICQPTRKRRHILVSRVYLIPCLKWEGKQKYLAENW